MQKLEKLKKKPDYAKFITTTEFNNASGEIFHVKLKKN